MIATELLEHVRDWRKSIKNLKHVLKPGGTLYVTTRSRGFFYHGWPYDFWRYEIDDMKMIFSDIAIRFLGSDPQQPGVFLKADKPSPFVEADLSELRLYSMVKHLRSSAVTDLDIRIDNLARFSARMVLPKRLVDHIKFNILNEGVYPI